MKKINLSQILHIARKVVVAMVLMAMVIMLILWFGGYWTTKIAPSSHTEKSMATSYHGPIAMAHIIRVPLQSQAIGTLEPIEPVMLAPRILGRVVFSRLYSGAVIHKGQVLVRMDNTDLVAQLNQTIAARALARAQLHQAQIDWRRMATLFKTADVTRAALDQANTKLASARADVARAAAAVQSARTVLGYTILYSTFNGMVMTKHVNVGDTVMPGQRLATLYNPRRMELVAVVPESLARHIRIGQDLSVALSGFAKPIAVHIREIVPRVSVQTRSFLVKAGGLFPTGVYPGMFGHLLIPLGQEKMLVVPQTAIEHIGQLNMVDIISHGIIRRQVVQLGSHHGTMREILSGVNAGQKLAVGRFIHD